MKRFISLILFLCLLLPCIALADVHSQVNAPESCQAAYTSGTGRTMVTVDAVVSVPEVDCIPTYSVSVRDFDVPDGIRLTELLHPSSSWERWEAERGLPYDEMFVASTAGANNSYEQRAWCVSLAEPDTSAHVSLRNGYLVGQVNRQPDERVLNYQWTDPETGLFFYHSASFGHADTIGQTLEGQALSVKEATDLANAFMAELAPDYKLQTVFGVEGETGDDIVHPTLAYCFAYTRSIGAVPVTYADYGHVYTPFEDRPMAPAPGQEFITVVIDGERIVNVHWQNPCVIGEVIQRQTELLPFEQIMRIFGAVAPLSMQSTESSAGKQANNGMNIREIRLGYMPVLSRDKPNQWELRPVWDFMGSRILPLATYNFPCYSLLTIDAIDGTVIDRNFGY